MKCASATRCGQDGKSVYVLHFVGRMVKVCKCSLCREDGPSVCYTLWAGWSKCASVTLFREDGQSVQVLHFVDRMVKVCKCCTL